MYVLLRVSNSRIFTTKPLEDIIEGHFNQVKDVKKDIIHKSSQSGITFT